MVPNPNILVVSAHAADFCSRCGGVIAKYSKAGSKVRVVDLSCGERAESGSLWQERSSISLEEVKAIRRAEAEKAAAVLGSEIRFLDWDETLIVVGKEELLELTDEIRDADFDSVITHWLKDPTHPDHATVGEAVVKACVMAHAPGRALQHPHIDHHPEVFFFESSVPMTEYNEFNPDTFIDITGVFDLKKSALKELSTQKELVDYYSDYGLHRGWQARFLSYDSKIKYAESFIRHRPWVGNFFP